MLIELSKELLEEKKNLLFKIEYLGISKIPNLQFRVEFYHI